MNEPFWSSHSTLYVSTVSLSRYLCLLKVLWYISDIVHQRERVLWSIGSTLPPAKEEPFPFCSRNNTQVWHQLFLPRITLVFTTAFAMAVTTPWNTCKNIRVPYGGHFWRRQPKVRYFADHKPKEWRKVSWTSWVYPSTNITNIDSSAV